MVRLDPSAPLRRGGQGIDMTLRPASTTRAFGALALLLLATGCATTAAPLDYRFKDGQENGLVLVSISQPTPGTQWKYRLVPATPEAGRHVLLTNGARGNDPVWIGSTVVIPFEVPEGNYEFYAWTEVAAPGGWYKFSTKEFSIPFKAVRGKVVYMGRIQLVLHLTDKRVELTVSDWGDRDIPAFLEHYRQVKEAQVVADVHPYPPPRRAVSVPVIPPEGLKLKSTF